MTGYILSPRAQSDLDGIWNYTETNWDRRQAEIYTRDIRQMIEAVVVNPRRGRPIDEIRKGYFKCPVSSHLIVYRIVGSDIDVIRILHKRMDIGRHL
jgi:toxin ParE1/3/4